MINIFSHYVPGRLLFLAGLEALVLLLSAYVGIALHLGEPGVSVMAFSTSMPPQAYVFALSMLGFPRLSNYDGSWNEWSGREDLPVEAGRV